ncbi:hypothetical protein HCC61_07580 [Streptomyces sp. HNM0575]|uniref:hypothetical protein n=1 Tax=Streptomyces sp. HNM0575 TaxID=2716338 RepID=UPI00145CE191|nr:hypothetical protein [Streptomyces sp. HNM0575]NLU72534.1 hypothetical protein [Streptomyces sp. HNM0575]
MLTTCPHCGTRSPASSDACGGCGRALYPLTAPPPPPPFKFRTRTNYVRLGITLGVMALLVGAGTSSGILMNRDDASDDRADHKVSQYKMVDTGASPEPSPTTASASPKVKEEKKKKVKPASPTPSPSKTSSSPPPKPEPTKDPGPQLPAGFHTVVDDHGFSLAVMEGWQRQELSPTQVGYMAPTGDQYLHVSEVEGAPKASFIRFLETEQAMQQSGNDYSRITLAHNTFQGDNGARWEFTYVPESGEQMHVVQQAYIDGQGTEYTIYFETAERLWDSQKSQVFSTALDTWKQP